MKQTELVKSPDRKEDNIVKNVHRRKFFAQAAGLASIAAFAAACDKDDNNSSAGGVDLGTGDIGILNYAYALEQLEAAFYTQVVATPYSGITAAEVSFM